MFGLFTNKTISEQSYREGEGIITKTIYRNHKWRVSFAATYWFAKSEQPVTLKPGDFVRVIGKENTNTLLVEPV